MATDTVYTYFDGESGRPLVSMTMRQAERCSHPGPCDDDVADTMPHVAFLADRAEMSRFLKRTGAWSEAELTASSDDDIRSRVLWIGAGDITEDPDLYR